MRDEVANDFLKFSINEYVYASLTERGWNAIKEHYKDVFKTEEELEHAVKVMYRDKLENIDGKDYCPIQLWTFMSIFGKYMYNGMGPEHALFGNNLLIEKNEMWVSG